MTNKIFLEIFAYLNELSFVTIGQPGSVLAVHLFNGIGER